jgi:hypothetical protein
MEMLASAGVDVDRRIPETGATALHYMATYGNVEGCHVLAAFGADISGPKHFEYDENAIALVRCAVFTEICTRGCQWSPRILT